MCKEYSAFKMPTRAQKANGSSSLSGRIKDLEAPALLGRLKIESRNWVTSKSFHYVSNPKYLKFCKKKFEFPAPLYNLSTYCSKLYYFLM